MYTNSYIINAHCDHDEENRDKPQPPSPSTEDNSRSRANPPTWKPEEPQALNNDESPKPETRENLLWRELNSV